MPVEILHLICSHLCLHCQRSHIVDLLHDVLEAARAGQKALAKLSRACQALRAAVQPVLFHHYYSDQDAIMSPDDDMMVPFLLSAVARPDLAASVRALALVNGPALSMTRQRYLTPQESTLLVQTAKEIGMSEAYEERTTPGWFRELAILLLPSMEQLLVDREYAPEFRFLETSPRTLPRLAYLALTGCTQGETSRLSYHLGEIQAVLSRAPNLEVLVAADCGYLAIKDWEMEWSRQKLYMSLPNLRKLSLDNLNRTF
ncbi:hypothetical protein GQ53DRAFT_884556 [Thozetella sp. PMI_491]|nr:hypothetical protein GQ53DRAFT_884556 [Thozetella sp. PMI_491]